MYSIYETEGRPNKFTCKLYSGALELERILTTHILY
jgi:hypothetical protein